MSPPLSQSASPTTPATAANTPPMMRGTSVVSATSLSSDSAAAAESPISSLSSGTTPSSVSFFFSPCSERALSDFSTLNSTAVSTPSDEATSEAEGKNSSTHSSVPPSTALHKRIDAATEPQPTSTSTPMRILLVDDNPLNLALLLRLLHRRFSNFLDPKQPPIALTDATVALDLLKGVMSVADAVRAATPLTVRRTMPEEARAQAAASALDNPHPSFTHVMLDIHMPAISGLSLARRIRGLPAAAPNRAAKLLACTTAVRHEEQRLYRAGGFDGLIEKPVRENTLRAYFDYLDDLTDEVQRPDSPGSADSSQSSHGYHSSTGASELAAIVNRAAIAKIGADVNVRNAVFDGGGGGGEIASTTAAAAELCKDTAEAAHAVKPEGRTNCGSDVPPSGIVVVSNSVQTIATGTVCDRTAPVTQRSSSPTQRLVRSKSLGAECAAQERSFFLALHNQEPVVLPAVSPAAAAAAAANVAREDAHLAAVSPGAQRANSPSQISCADVKLHAEDESVRSPHYVTQAFFQLPEPSQEEEEEEKCMQPASQHDARKQAVHAAGPTPKATADTDAALTAGAIANSQIVDAVVASPVCASIKALTHSKSVGVILAPHEVVTDHRRHLRQVSAAPIDIRDLAEVKREVDLDSFQLEAHCTYFDATANQVIRRVSGADENLTEEELLEAEVEPVGGAFADMPVHVGGTVGESPRLHLGASPVSSSARSSRCELSPVSTTPYRGTSRNRSHPSPLMASHFSYAAPPSSHRGEVVVDLERELELELQASCDLATHVNAGAGSAAACFLADDGSTPVISMQPSLSAPSQLLPSPAITQLGPGTDVVSTADDGHTPPIALAFDRMHFAPPAPELLAAASSASLPASSTDLDERVAAAGRMLSPTPSMADEEVISGSEPSSACAHGTSCLGVSSFHEHEPPPHNFFGRRCASSMSSSAGHTSMTSHEGSMLVSGVTGVHLDSEAPRSSAILEGSGAKMEASPTQTSVMTMKATAAPAPVSSASGDASSSAVVPAAAESKVQSLKRKLCRAQRPSSIDLPSFHFPSSALELSSWRALGGWSGTVSPRSVVAVGGESAEPAPRASHAAGERDRMRQSSSSNSHEGGGLLARTGELALRSFASLFLGGANAAAHGGPLQHEQHTLATNGGALAAGPSACGRAWRKLGGSSRSMPCTPGGLARPHSSGGGGGGAPLGLGLLRSEGGEEGKEELVEA